MSQRIRTTVLAAALVAGTGVLGGATPASAVPVWNANGPIHPGVQTYTAGGQCTANFVFYDSSNNVYIGQSAHCASTGGPTDTNGCITGSQPIGTNVTVTGATRPGKLVYSSWIAMKSDPSVTSAQCAYNDFAIVKLDAADYGRVNPSVPFWGGPQGVNTSGLPARSYVYTYGNSSLRFGLTPLSPKVGQTTTTTPATGWRYSVYTVSPGIPGDSGSAFLDRNGAALGTLSTLSTDGSNGVMNLNLALAYLRSHSTLTSLQVANGLTTFDPIV
ncbi:MAG TPA: serine protease [Frankiaceae bacterium]|nr:serine protease [Frankiaceae bacterium]